MEPLKIQDHVRIAAPDGIGQSEIWKRDVLVKSSLAVNFTVGIDIIWNGVNINNIDDVVITITNITKIEREAKEREIVGQDEPTPTY